MMTPFNADFWYSPLLSSSKRSIRLIELNDRFDSRNGPLPFSILGRYLEDAPPYLALSYTWDDPSCPFLDLLTPLPISPVETRCDNEPFFVQPNLSGALERLVSLFQESPNTYIWIDAICINQADEMEKTSQVKMMGEIYSRAQKVYAWLGPKDASSDEALYILDQISEPSLETIKNASGSVDFKYPETYTQRLGILPIPVGWWFAWGALMTRNYFKRAWILQEVVIAAEVTFLIGDSQTEMFALGKTVLYLEELKWIQFLRPGPSSMVMKTIDELRNQIPKKYEKMIGSSLASITPTSMMANMATTRIRHKYWQDAELISFSTPGQDIRTFLTYYSFSILV